MYRDTAGKVTVGVGVTLPDAEAACALPFVVDGGPASAEQIGEEFARVTALPPGKAAGFYKRPGSPELAQETVDAKLESILVGFEGELRARLAGYDELPDGVKMALLDMAYSLGPEGLLEGYPRLIRAVETGAWSKAAAECAREGIGEARNAWVRQQFLSAVVAAIRAEAGAQVAAEAEAAEESGESWFGKLRRELRKPLWTGKK
jgi:GH24 family phage-related lysozyme (muramidase)